MLPDLENMSADERNSLVASIREKRSRVPALSENCIRVIVKNHSFYEAKVENPFLNISNSVTQKIFHRLMLDNPCIAKREAFIQLLHNKSIKSPIENYNFNFKIPFFQCLINNCPNINSIFVDLKYWKNYVYDSRPEYSSLNPHFPFGNTNLYPNNHPYWLGNTLQEFFLEMSQKWKKLESLHIGDFNNINEAICLIQKYLPNLKELQLDSYGDITMASAEIFSEMKQLNNLSIKLKFPTILVSRRFLHKLTDDDSLWAHAAGKIPNLKRIQSNLFVYDPCYQGKSQFVKLFGQLFPMKQLLISDYRIQESLECSWPQNVQVDKLTIHGSKLNDEDWKNMTTMPKCVRKLMLLECNLAIIYNLLEHLGSEVRNLYIFNSRWDYWNWETRERIQKTPLDLHKVLDLCPKLEYFDVDFAGSFEKRPVHNIVPQNFRNFQGFYFNLVDAQQQSEVLYLYKMFLMGSVRQLNTLNVRSGPELQIILDVLKQETCTCLHQVQKLCFYLKDCEIPCEVIFEVAYLLIECSPKLKKIDLNLNQNMLNQNFHSVLNEKNACFLEFAGMLGIKYSLRISDGSLV